MSNGPNTPDAEVEKAVVPATPAQSAPVLPKADVAMGPRGLMPENLPELWRLAEGAARSGVFPQVAGNPNKAFSLMAYGMELGFTPFRSLSAVTIIEGKPSLPGEAALALVRSKRVLKPGTDFEVDYEGEGDAYGCRVTVWRNGWHEPREERFNVHDAKIAGLWGKKTKDGHDTSWIRYPKDMLFWRALARLLRRYFSDVTMGLYTSEELRDVALLERGVEEQLPEAATAMPDPVAPDPLLARLAAGPAEEPA